MKSSILNLGITIDTFDNIKCRIVNKAKTKQRLSVFLCNAHMLIEAYQDIDFKKMFNNTDVVTADGISIKIALKVLKNITQERICGMDLLPQLLVEAAREEFAVFFYGTNPSTLKKVIQKCNMLHPRLKIAGSFSPPFRELIDDDINLAIDLFNESKPNIVFVALGCPKQEKFISQVAQRTSTVLIGIGGALPVFAGEIRRSPQVMQKYGMEWLFRLLQEPKRLWKRYLITNSIFVWLIIREIAMKKNKEEER